MGVGGQKFTKRRDIKPGGNSSQTYLNINIGKDIDTDVDVAIVILISIATDIKN